MRTDAQIDKRQVLCKGADCSGFGKIRAQVGDILRYGYGEIGFTHTGRMVGRVHYAPALSGDKGPIRDWILVAELCNSFDQVYERWINPLWVGRIVALSDKHKAALKWFLSEDMVKQDQAIVRSCLSDGWSSFEAYLAYSLKEVPMTK